MAFKDTLNYYMEQAHCSVKTLAAVSDLSASVISRYRSGERTPGIDSEPLHKLSLGIAALLSKDSGQSPDVSYEKILEDFQSQLHPKLDAAAFASKIDDTITELGINVSAMAKALNYDPSFLSRIRTGSRMPSDVTVFVQKVAGYLAANYPAKDLLQFINSHSNAPEYTKEHNSDIRHLLELFFLNAPVLQQNHASGFLHKLDDFDLDVYIRSIHFDTLKVPSAPFMFHLSREYHGIEGQKKAELDFLKGTVLSKSDDDVFLCSDIDMSDMANDLTFSKNWMLGLALILKRNMNITIIHNLNRPFQELMLGLEAWIPLYMSGRCTPFYLKGNHNDFYQHLLYTSGNYALQGECIKQYHDKAKYALSNSKEDVAYAKERASCILKKAHPLMDIHTSDNSHSLHLFIKQAENESGNRHYLFSSLPVFMLPDAFLTDILKKNNLADDAIGMLLKKIHRHRKNMEHLLIENKLLLEVPFISETEFLEHPLSIHLMEYDYFSPVSYQYADYIVHTQALNSYADAHENCTIRLNTDFAFRNIQIRILEGKWVWISKVKSPAIHFVIRHPKLLDAIENMYIPVYE